MRTPRSCLSSLDRFALLALSAVTFSYGSLHAREATARIAGTVGTASQVSLESSTSILDPRGSAVIKQLCGSATEAADAARAAANAIGGDVLRTSGTPSMEPFIHGITYVVIEKVAYQTIRPADLLVYFGRTNPRRAERTCLLHRAVDHDRYGWLMSGDNNRWSESWDRVTPENYVGRVTMIFEPQATEIPSRVARR